MTNKCKKCGHEHKQHYNDKTEQKYTYCMRKCCTCLEFERDINTEYTSLTNEILKNIFNVENGKSIKNQKDNDENGLPTDFRENRQCDILERFTGHNPETILKHLAMLVKDNLLWRVEAGIIPHATGIGSNPMFLMDDEGFNYLFSIGVNEKEIEQAIDKINSDRIRLRLVEDPNKKA